MAFGPGFGYSMTPLLNQPAFDPASLTATDMLDVIGQQAPLGGGGLSSGISFLPPGIQMPPPPGIGGGPMDVLSAGSAGPLDAITSQGAKQGLLSRWADSPLMPTFGMDELTNKARRDAMKAGLFNFGSGLLSTMGPGNQNLMGNIGSAMQGGMGAFQGALAGADQARMAQAGLTLDQEKQAYAIAQAERQQREQEQALDDMRAERQRILESLPPEKAEVLGRFAGAPDKDFYGKMDELTTEEEKDRVLRTVNKKLYEIPEEGEAQLVGGIDYSDQGITGTVDPLKLSDEAMRLAREQLTMEQAAQDRAREWASDQGATFAETIPQNRLDQLYKEKLELVKDMFKGAPGETRAGGGEARPTSEASAEGATVIQSAVSRLPAQVQSEIEPIWRELLSQGKSPQEILRMLDEAMGQ